MNADDMRRAGKEGVDVTMSSWNASSKGTQAILAELTSYSKKSFERSVAAWENVMGAKSLETVLQVQGEYVKSCYEDFVAEATKLGELYIDFAKETYRPYEGAIARATPSK